MLRVSYSLLNCKWPRVQVLDNKICHSTVSASFRVQMHGISVSADASLVEQLQDRGVQKQKLIYPLLSFCSSEM